MQRYRKMIPFFVKLCLFLAFTQPCRAAGLDADLKDEDVDRLIKLLQPNPHERWRMIPWKISLLEGQKLAAEQRKPIFIWAMDGHPLGCT